MPRYSACFSTAYVTPELAAIVLMLLVFGVGLFAGMLLANLAMLRRLLHSSTERTKL